jgi:sirohydrochlorin ferrochelatase
MRHPHLTPAAGPAGDRPPLIAVAHGSSDPRAAATVTALLGLVRARAAGAGLPGLRVRAAYLGHALPSVADALAALCPALPGDQLERNARAAVVLPLLLTAAYHSDTDLPAALSQAGARLPGLRISYGRPLGPDERLLRAMDRRLAETGGPASPAGSAGTAVVLAAAGSSRAPANAEVARLAAAWRSVRGWRQVVPAYASAASPTPAQAVTGLLRAGAPRVVVATYLLAPGVFADQILRASLAAGADAVSAPLGAAPEVADVILERYRQAARRRDPGLAAGSLALLRRGGFGFGQTVGQPPLQASGGEACGS